MQKVTVIIAAAGNASRMGGITKQLAQLCGKPVIVHSMEVFQRMDEVAEIIVSAKDEHADIIGAAAEKHGITKLAAIVSGGETRQGSVINGLKAASKETSLIAVHDAARPLVKEKFVRQCIRDAEIFGAAALGVPVKDTLKVVSGGLVTDTPDRSSLYAIQTPQIFRKDVYYKGVNFAVEHGLDFTDDCQLVEAVGVKVCVSPSDYFNIKITTPEDLQIAEILSKIEDK
ncbi:MAG: 2-C-methyl-D-erythritol 4-phosphate cytidylyltransferase [Oscillospiraceae bacterium]|nr:2-C-methyl-D-erythritol 4-phosphate cytidylyltransferase [Oscillospiraceae bacterium]